MTTNSTPTVLLQDNDPQKLLMLHNQLAGTGIEPGVHVVAATTKEHGLQTEVVDLRGYIPGVLASSTAGTRVVTDAVSFKAELSRYKLHPTASTVWGDENTGKVVAIYNDHINADDDVDGAGLRDDRLMLALRADADWVAWHKLSGKYLPQMAFGDEVEELLPTVVQPDQAELMEVIDSIRATSKGVFESAIQRSTGAQKLEYHEDVQSKAGRAHALEVPKELVLALRPWEGMDTYEVRAWFRIRIINGELGLAVKLRPTRTVLRQAWSDIVADLESDIDHPVLATNL